MKVALVVLLSLAGWTKLDVTPPEVDRAEGLRVDSAEVTGDPALGCFALTQTVSAPAGRVDAEVAMRSLVEALAADGFAVKRHEDVIELSGRGITGRMRAAIDTHPGERALARATACFYNDREPEQCRMHCDSVLASAGDGP